MPKSSAVPAILDQLESHYGPQEPSWPTDPYAFLVWWHCGCPASNLERLLATFSLQADPHATRGNMTASIKAEATLKDAGFPRSVAAQILS